MGREIIQALSDLESEKGIKKEYMLERISQALMAAYKALYKRDAANSALDNIDVHIDPVSGEIIMQAVKTVAEEVTNPATEISMLQASKYMTDPHPGDQIKIPVNTNDFRPHCHPNGKTGYHPGHKRSGTGHDRRGVRLEGA